MEVIRLLARVVLGSLVAVFIVVSQGSPANATHYLTAYIDDKCGAGLSSNGLFWAEGPAMYWYVVQGQGGYNNCYMWTTTLDGNLGGAPVNRAWWYTDSQSPWPDGVAKIQYYIRGQHTSCYNVYYNYMPSGDFGPNYSYWRAQFPQQWTQLTDDWVYPAQGGKAYLGDKQFCSVNSSIEIDATLWDWWH